MDEKIGNSQPDDQRLMNGRSSAISPGRDSTGNAFGRFWERAAGRSWLIAVLVAYVLIYGGLLIATDGLPYIIDNNESFSSLWHAANLYDFGLSQSYGLADESFSPHAAAHPYVHTHQGNLPRLFAFLIYAVGARTVESQIVITTFTVGLAAIGLVWLFFARVATPVFAALVCAVFMTDYILFAQWHVVTYRVWHCFLLFLALYSIERATEPQGKKWLFGVGAAFWGLLYYELVFAAFAGVFCALYAIYRCGKNWRRAVLIILAQAAGGSLALLLVISQVIGYLGFADFRRDIYLTFLARNDISSVSGLLAEANRFYESRRVIFWHNLQDRAVFSGFSASIRSFTSFDWRIHTPMLAVTTWILASGWLLSLLPQQVSAGGRRAIVAGTCTTWVVAIIFLLPPAEHAIFDGTFKPVWDELHRLAGPHAIGILAGMVASAVAASMGALGAGRIFGETRRAWLTGVLGYLVCGALAYVGIFLLSPGYIYSGYLHRHAPFTVFLTDVVVAVALYAVGHTTVALLKEVSAGANPRGPFRQYAIESLGGASILLTLGFVGYWIAMQAQYIRWMPPDYYAFVKKLAEPPFKGASFVANNYTAPVAAHTGQWAYFDPGLAQAHFLKEGSTTHLAGDTKYLWFADRETNSEYRAPQYFICMINQTPMSVLQRVLREKGIGVGELGCSSLPLVKLARDGTLKGISLVEYDRAGLKETGTDHWAILKLDWDKAPGGTVLDWSIKPPDPVRETGEGG
jgi:hypothetical protein